MPAVRVLISYSHDSPAHAERVLALAQRLRGDGVDVRLDRFVGAPTDGWPRWMLTEITAADRVIMVCTPTYRRRCEGHEDPGKGHGVAFEGLLLLQYLYDHASTNHGNKLVPVVYPDPNVANALAAIPLPLRPFPRYTLDRDYDSLLRALHGQDAITPAPLGPAKVCSPGIDNLVMTPEDALYQLLLSVFSADELRRWIRYDAERQRIAHDLPGATASASALVTAAIEALARHKLIDAKFFADLRRERERRSAEIARVEQLWQQHVSPAPSPAPAAPAPVAAGITNTNQSGGIFAPGAVFTIGGDFVQGSKHEVHHDSGDRKKPQK